MAIRTDDAVADIFAILHDLASPREGAKALAGAHVLLLKAEGVRTEADARVRVAQSSTETLRVWRDRAGLVAN